MTRVAAVDCGTNTIKLLVADLDADSGTDESLVREMRTVRLGQGVDRTGRLAEEALARVFAAAEEYAGLVDAHRVEALRFVATSAVRDASNSHDFAAGIYERLGVRPEVASGEVEAELSFDGATRALIAVGHEVADPVLVIDIGGGSTELIVGETGAGHGVVRASRSLDVGSVRLTERLLPTDPPTTDEVAAAAAVVDEALDTLPAYGVRLDEPRTLVGVAGTVTTLGAVALGLAAWDRDRVHLASLPVGHVRDLAARVLAMTVAEREAIGVPVGRSDVIGAGVLILDRVLARTHADRLVVSDCDILDGIAWSLV